MPNENNSYSEAPEIRGSGVRIPVTSPPKHNYNDGSGTRIIVPPQPPKK